MFSYAVKVRVNRLVIYNVVYTHYLAIMERFRKKTLYTHPET